MTTDRPNVLLIVLDSVRAANTSLHGHVHDTTPFLSALTDSATHYTQARAPAVWSLPSHTSMFTGRHVVEHDIVDWHSALEPGHTVWERLGDAGYDTAAFSENGFLTEYPVGLKDAFDTVEGRQDIPYPDALYPRTAFDDDEDPPTGLPRYVEYVRRSLASDRPMQALTNGAVLKIDANYPNRVTDRLKPSPYAELYGDLFRSWAADRSGPWAACINFMDAHLPYEPSPEHDRWGGERLHRLQQEITDMTWEFNGGQRPWWQLSALESLYDGAIRQTDAEIERLAGWLRDRGEFENTLVVVTSDHGEGFGEPSRIRPNTRIAGHGGRGIHEVLTHVPLVVKYPGQTEGRTVRKPTTLTRFPTAVAAAREGDWDETEPWVPDGPVVASAEGLHDRMAETASRYCEDLSRFEGPYRAVYDQTAEGDTRKATTWRDRHQTLVLPGSRTAYEPHEADDPAARVAAAFNALSVASLGRDHGEMEAMDTETEERLEDLGYL